MASRPLYSCAVYVSSGLQSVASLCAAAAARVPRVAVVDVFSDPAYARSSVKLVAEAGPLVKAAEAAAVEALSLVDLSKEVHPAPHPRQGSVDSAFANVPHPSSQCSPMRTRAIATTIWSPTGWLI